MTWNYFFKDRSGAQNGPVSLDELAALTLQGRLAPDCLVWAEGGEPAAAAAFPVLAQAFRQKPGFAPASGTGPLQADLPAWGLFWRGVVYVVGVAMVVPAPWAGRWFYNWFAGRIALPNGRRLFLESSIGACWLIFAGIGLAAIVPDFFRHTDAYPYARLASGLSSEALAFLLVGWFSRSLRSEDGALDIGFGGGFWAYLGWDLLMVLSLVTVVGWAWVARSKMRWICRHAGGSHQFEFVASGWQILWRTFAMLLGSALVVTIPWLMRWYLSWCIAQIVAAPGAASVALASGQAA